MDIEKIRGDLITDEDIKILIVASKFNEIIVDKLVSGCCSKLEELGVAEENIQIIEVPGAREIPLAIKKVIEKTNDKNAFDAIVALSCVIRGDTPHFEYVAQELSKGTAKISLDFGVPVVFGAITANNMEEAIDRAGGKMGNKGKKAAEDAIEMINLISEINNEF